jgi:fructose 1,6-bisphosphate aldolase/phosphatase
MKITLSAIKADIGSIGGHTRPSDKLLKAVDCYVRDHKPADVIDYRIYFLGDDISLLFSHIYGVDAREIHSLAWNSFKEGTRIAKEQGLYGAGQDLLVEAFSGNVRGMGPGDAELEFEERPNEAFVVIAADKTEPGTFNEPLYKSFTDPCSCSGLMLSPEMRKGFKFTIMDVGYTEGDKVIELYAPENYWDISTLLFQTHEYVVESIHSRFNDQQVAAVSTSRLHNIAGKYTGKDDPIMIVRAQKPFPATEEILGPFAYTPYVGGDSRGSHNQALMPVAINTPAGGFYCNPIVSCLAFSMHNGRFTEPVDMFGEDEFWHTIRSHAVEKSIEIKKQNPFGPSMLPRSELEYTGVKQVIEELEKKFKVRKAKPQS